MSIHQGAVKNSELFREFDKLAGFEDVSPADIDLLKAMVLDVAERVGPHLDWIKLTFHQYTAHDIQHLLNIADHVHSFVPRLTVSGQTVVGLNAVELTYLWLAILLHDVGMFVSQATEKQAILDSPDYENFLGHHRERLAVARAAEAADRTVTAQAIDDALFAEFIRYWHAERVHGYIRTYLPERLRFREIDLSSEVGNLCESHNWGVREPRDSRQQERCVEKMDRQDYVGKTRVNMAYLAICLRLGDILDFDRSRTPLSAFHQIHFTEALSVQEWNKHLSIKGINVSEHRVQYVAKCATPEDYIAVQQFLNWVDRELQECTSLVQEFPQTDAERYLLNLSPIVDRHLIRMANPQMVAGGFRFQLEYDRIMQLLMDKSLYPDETMFLRELLQNALDACRYQSAIAQDKGMQDKYVPRIQVWDHSAVTHRPDGPDGGPRIIFGDNGVGMSLYQVENYFMRVGKSFYTSPDFRAERDRLARKGIHLDACSQFGIGFLSCFLGGDRVEVETYHYGSEPLKITINGPSTYFVIQRLNLPLDSPVQFNSPADPLLDSPPRCCGTKVTVFLRDGWRKNPSEDSTDLVYRTLDRVAANQQIPITVVNSTGNSHRVIAASRWDREPPGAPRGFRPGEILSHLIPSAFSLAETGKLIRGQGAIWFLSNDGAPVPQKGDLILAGGWVFLSGFIHTVHFLLSGAAQSTASFKKLAKALGDLQKNPGDGSAIFARLQRQYRGTDMPEEHRFLALVEGDIDWAIHVARRGIQKRTRERGGSGWLDDPGEIAALLDQDRDRLAQIWSENGMPSHELDQLRGEYRLALFGIESPGGFQTWNAATGHADRHNWIPDGVTVKVDTYGDFAPRPAASRLYVPHERSERVRAAVTRACLLHAGECWKSHARSGDWTRWYHSFLYSCSASELALLRNDSDIRRSLIEFRDARPKKPSPAFYTKLGAVHSAFGEIVLTRYLDGDDPYLDLVKPIPHARIRSAAAKAGVDASKVASTVDSLSEFLGWDITKGHPQ